MFLIYGMRYASHLASSWCGAHSTAEALRRGLDLVAVDMSRANPKLKTYDVVQSTRRTNQTLEA